VAIILDGTNGIAAANVFGRNIIINGDGRINQRGYTSGTATSGANQYTLDRWRVVTSGQNLTFTGDDSGREMTAPAGGVEQVIEDKNISGGTYVLNWEGTATATVGGNAVAKGGTFTLTANTNATLRMIDGTFKNVQIEQGSVATPFERRPYGTELALCLRYFEKSFPIGTAPADNINTTAANTTQFLTTSYSGAFYVSQNFNFQVSKRAGPTMTFYAARGVVGTDGAAGQWRSFIGGVWVNHSSTASNQATNTGFIAAGDYSSGGTTGQAYFATGEWTASAEL
jgi:hypothetical protein